MDTRIKLGIILIYSFMLLFCFQGKNKLYERITYYTEWRDPIFQMNIPVGYELHIAGNSEGYIYKYSYPDSTIIYMDGNSYTGLNYDNIQLSGQYNIVLDSLGSENPQVISGTDEKERVWKNIRSDKFSIGYLNAPINRYHVLDSCLNTGRFIKRNPWID